MAISLSCPECDNSLRLRDDLAGKRIKCPGCEAVIRVPSADERIQLKARSRAHADCKEADANRTAPVKRRGGSRKHRTSRVTLVVSLGAAALIALGAALTIAFWPKKPADANAQNKKPDDGAPAEPVERPRPNLPLGRETTYLDGPLDNEGYIDYQAALNDRLGKGITPETNANVLLIKAVGPRDWLGKGKPAEFFKRLGIDQLPEHGDYFIPYYRFLKDQVKVGDEDFQATYNQQVRVWLRPWKVSDYPHVAAWLSANEKPLALVVAASARSEYFSPVVNDRTAKNPGSFAGSMDSDLPSKVREAYIALAAKAMLHVGEGKFREAWPDLLACHRLGRLLARGATPVDGLFGIAADSVASAGDLAYLERADLTVTEVQERLKDLEELAPFPPLADKVELAERLTYLDSLQLIRRSGPGVLDFLAGDWLKKAPEPTAGEWNAIERINWERAMRVGNRWHDRTAAALRLRRYGDRKFELDKIRAEVEALSRNKEELGKLAALIRANASPGEAADMLVAGFLIDLLVSGVCDVQERYDRSEQTHRNLRVAFALAAYRHDHGHYPAKLDELAPRYLPTIPEDLFSGKPLIYRPSDNGYLLYSVGVNGQDDGGRSFGDEPPGDDLVVRMPLPPLKGKK